jgi:uncharacterized membrane protein (DUF106 family)
MNKEGSFKPVLIVFALSFVIAIFWDSLTFISAPIHAVLDPTLGAMLRWNVTVGMIIIIAVLTAITTLIQKYTTDQDEIRELKKKQKEINERAKEFKHHPEKMLEVQKELGPVTMKMMKLSMRGVVYTGIPLIIFFRWFTDIFEVLGNPKFFGFMGWLIFYLLGSIILGSIFRKIFKVV